MKNFYFFSIITFIISLLGSGIINTSFAIGENNSYTKNIIRGENYEQIFEDYLENKSDESSKWITFMSILSTLFAVFFVYSSFKIDKDLKEMNGTIQLIDKKKDEILDNLQKAYNSKIEELNQKTEEEKEEINQKNEEEKEELKNENKFINMVSYYNNEMIENGNYESVIEGLNGLLSEDYVLNDNDKYNRVLFYLSKAYYGKWFKEGENFDTIENLSQAIIYANEAIEDPNDPYKNMLISRFNEFETNFNS